MRKSYKRFLSTIVTILVSFNLIVSPTFFDRANASATASLDKSKLAPPLMTDPHSQRGRANGIIKFLADTRANDAIERLKGRLKLETSADSIKTEIAEAIETVYKMLPDNGKISLVSIVDQIQSTNLEHPYRIKKGLPLTIVFGPQVFPAYNGKPPKLIAITFDNDFIAVNSVSSDSGSLDDVLGKGGCRWYQAGTDNVTFEDKVLQILPEAVRLGETMGDKNPWSGVFFDGGKTVFLAREGIHKERAIKRWVASSAAANVLLVHYIAGPDMGMGENEMAWIAEEADKAQKELSEQFSRRILATTSRRPGLGSYPHEPWTVTSISVVETMLEALENSQLRTQLDIKDIEPITLSIQGFGDVGSGVIEYLWGLLTDLKEQAARRELSPEEKIRLGLLERIKIVGVSDINGGIYNSEGLDIKELLRLRALRIERWSKREREDFFIKEEYLNEVYPRSGHYGQISRGNHKVIAGTEGKKLRENIQAVAKAITVEIESDASTHSLAVDGLTVYVDSELAALRNDAQIKALLAQALARLTPEEYGKLLKDKKLTIALLDSSFRLFDSYLYNDFKLIAINPDMLERGHQPTSLFETTGQAEILFKGATVIIPAAGPNVFTNAEQVEELKERNTKMMVEAANNSIKLVTEKAFHAEGILYFPGAVANFGGIFSSTREFIDVTAEGEEAVLANIEERKRVLQSDIRNVARTNAGWLLAQYQNLRGERSIYDIHQETVAKIRQRRTELLKTPTGSMLSRVAEETNRGTNGLPEKVARLIAATELARAEALGLELPPQKDAILSAVFTKIIELVKKIFTAVEKKLAAIALQYGLSRGHEVVLQYLSVLLKKENIDVHPESEIMVLDGIAEAENIMARLFINKGDTVVFQKGSLTEEDKKLYEYHGAALIEFERVEDLSETLRKDGKVKFIQVLSDKKEGGEALNQQERNKVLALTRQHNLLLIEDARYRDPVMAKTPSIKEMDESGINSRVIQIRNLSPLFGEGVDMGCAYAVLPAAVAVKFEATQGSATLHPNSLTQVIVYQELLSRYAQEVPIPKKEDFTRLSDAQKNSELPLWISEKLSKYGKEVKLSEIRRILKLMATEGLIALAGGMPAVELFPYNETYELIAGFTEADWQEALTRSPVQGLERLRKLIAERLNRENNLKENSAVNAEDILITDGSQEGLDILGWLATQIAQDEGRENEIITQKPTYLGLISAVKPFGCKVVPYHLNSLEGLAKLEGDLRERRSQGKKLPALIYVMPTFGNPDGDVMSLEARERLLDIADEFGIRIAEDDPYSALKYDDKPLPGRLLELSRKRGISDKVIYLGTISKIFTPGVRIGWTVASKEIIEKLVQYKAQTTGGANSFTQVLASRFFETGFVDSHIEKLMSVYKERHGAMIRALETYFKDTGATWTEGRGGFFIWLTLPKDFNAEILLEKMTQEGVEVEVDGIKKLTKVGFVPGWAFLGDDNQLRLSFPTNPPEAIDRAIKAISIAVKDKMFDFLAETLTNLTQIGELDITPEGIFLKASDTEQIKLLAYKDTLKPYLAILRTAMTSVKPRWYVLTIPQGATKEQIKALITEEISPPATAKLTSIAKGTGTPARALNKIWANFKTNAFTIDELWQALGEEGNIGTARAEVKFLERVGVVREVSPARGNIAAKHQLDDRFRAITDEDYTSIAAIEDLNNASFDNPRIFDTNRINELQHKIDVRLSDILDDPNLVFDYPSFLYRTAGPAFTDTDGQISSKVVVLQPHMIAEALGFIAYLENLIANTRGEFTIVIDGSQIDDLEGFLQVTGLKMKGDGYMIIRESVQETVLDQASNVSSNIIAVGTDGYLTKFWTVSDILKLQVDVGASETSTVANLGILPIAIAIASNRFDRLPDVLKERITREGNTYTIGPTAVSQAYSEGLSAYKKILGAK